MKSKSEKKKLMMIAAAAAAVILTAAAVLILKKASPGETKQQSPAEETAASETADAEKGKELQETVPEKGSSPAESGEGTVPKHSEGAGMDDQTEEMPVQKPGEAGGKTIAFPYRIEDSGLEIQTISHYDGIFLEDGTDEEVSGITIAVFKNTGKKQIEYAEVTISRDGVPLLFKLSTVPAGKAVAVQEAGKVKYAEGTYTDCSANVAYQDQFEMSENAVEVKDNGDNSLTVKNLTDKKIAKIRVFYKYYTEEDDAYVGGITYNAAVDDLKAGESVNVRPIHFVSGASRVVMVRTYEE